MGAVTTFSAPLLPSTSDLFNLLANGFFRATCTMLCWLLLDCQASQTKPETFQLLAKKQTVLGTYAAGPCAVQARYSNLIPFGSLPLCENWLNLANKFKVSRGKVKREEYKAI